jgi:hypothetical protein
MDIAAAITSPLARLGALAALSSLAACVTDANKCLPGFTYAPQYDACLEDATPTDGGSESAAEATTPASDAAPSSDAASAGDSGLGNSCNAGSDCPGSASFCLKDPTAAPTDPGICSIPGCTSSACGSAYSCCDCTAALITALTQWPKNVCAPADNKSTLVQFGCTCQ